VRHLGRAAQGVRRVCGRRILAIVTVHQATASMFDQGVPVLTLYLQQALGVSLGFAAAIATVSNLGRAAASIPIGRLSDRMGGRRVLTIAGFMLGSSLGVVSLLHGVWSVSCLLVMGGICTAASTPAGSRAIIDAYPPGRRAVPLGIRQTGVPIGGLIVGFSLPLIAQAASVQAALLTLAAAGLLGGLLALVLPRSGRTSRARSQAPRPAVAGPAAWRNATACWGAILVIGQFGFLAFALPYLVRALGRSSLAGAGVIVMAQVGAIIGRVWWSWLAGSGAGRRRLAMITLSLAACAAACLMAALTAATPTWALYALAFGYGSTAMAWNGLWVLVVSELAPVGREASALGAGLTLVNVAAALGPWLLGAVLSLSGSFRLMWLALGMILGCSLPAALLSITRDGPAPPTAFRTAEPEAEA
jgi:MFS family permease